MTRAVLALVVALMCAVIVSSPISGQSQSAPALAITAYNGGAPIHDT
jgi:hypothetical protein